MPPHWSPLQPWLPAGVPLTFNLWPSAPQNSSEPSAQSTQRGAHPVKHCHGDREERQEVQVLTVSTGVNSEYKCYRCSVPPPPPLLVTTHHINKIIEILSVFVTLWIYVWVFACHGHICPDAPGLKRGSCCSLMESCLLQRDPVTRALRFHPY